MCVSLCKSTENLIPLIEAGLLDTLGMLEYGEHASVWKMGHELMASAGMMIDEESVNRFFENDLPF